MNCNPQSSGTTNLLLSADFINVDTGWACGPNGTILRTINGGTNWILQHNGTSFLASIKFTNGLTGWVVGGAGVILITNTSGIVQVSHTSSNIRDKFYLSQNFPNPFNPETIVRYEIPLKSHISLVIFDALGKEILTLVRGQQNAGSYEVKVNAVNLPGGIYFLKMSSGEFTETKKMLLIK